MPPSLDAEAGVEINLLTVGSSISYAAGVEVRGSALTASKAASFRRGQNLQIPSPCPQVRKHRLPICFWKEDEGREPDARRSVRQAQ